jgi:hypothetical protein
MSMKLMSSLPLVYQKIFFQTNVTGTNYPCLRIYSQKLLIGEGESLNIPFFLRVMQPLYPSFMQFPLSHRTYISFSRVLHFLFDIYSKE